MPSRGRWSSTGRCRFPRCIAATRRDGTGELHISSTRKSTWLVSHPVTTSNGDSVSVINLATNTVSATIGVGSLPSRVAVNPAGTFAYVTNSRSNSVSVIAL